MHDVNSWLKHGLMPNGYCLCIVSFKQLFPLWPLSAVAVTYSNGQFGLVLHLP